MKRRTPVVIALSCLLPLAGCMSAEQRAGMQAVSAYCIGDYAQARQLLQPIASQTNEDFVLNNDRLGSTALAQYDLLASQAAFLRSYEVINSVGVNNGGRSLGAALVDERIKVWKGEPFERAMANFYLGLIYYTQGDYNNARAAFENSLFKLHDYPSKDDLDHPVEVESSFALSRYMLARCFQRLGRDDLAAANFQKLVKNHPQLTPLGNAELNKKSNLLLVIDFGFGPRKVTDDDGSLVGFAPTPQEVGPPLLPVTWVDGQAAGSAELSQPLTDLIAMAQDRRWETIDTIRAVKSAIGSGLIIGGAADAALGQRQTDAEVGLALIAAGFLLKATSQADTRVWEMLPRSTYAIPLVVSPGVHDVTVQFPAAGAAQTLHGITVPASGDSTYYIRMQPFAPRLINWPPPTLRGWPATQP